MITLFIIAALLVLLPVTFILGRMDGQSRPAVVMRLREWNRNLEKWETVYQQNARTAFWFIKWRKNAAPETLSEGSYVFDRGAVVTVEWFLTSDTAMMPDGAR